MIDFQAFGRVREDAMEIDFFALNPASQVMVGGAVEAPFCTIK